MHILSDYARKRDEIESRMEYFRRPKSEEEIFSELVFCLLTPQSKARVCDRAVKTLFDTGAVFKDGVADIKKHLKGVRFHNTKADRIVKARALLTGLKGRLNGNPMETREWLVENVDGLGYKEASHFLRNIGMGENLAILDRHILKNLMKHGVISGIPKSMTRKRYMEIEQEMKRFSERVNIPLAHLDLLFWSQETGEIFK